jgi:hypothetical protein
MTALGWATMVAICGIVWGGFGWLLRRAIRAERRKCSQGESGSP